MKNKFILFLIPLCGLFAMTTCTLENEEDEMAYVQDQKGNMIDITGTIVTEYPTEIDTYVTHNITNAIISFVTLRTVANDYLVELNDARLLLINTDGSYNQELIRVEEDDD